MNAYYFHWIGSDRIMDMYTVDASAAGLRPIWSCISHERDFDFISMPLNVDSVTG